MSPARYLVGDVYAGLATLPDNSVDLVFSSPPFLALRSYLPADHPDKAKEIGSEATPADFLDTLLDVVEACDRVLAPHGSLCFELGDTFAGSAQEKREAVLDGSARWGGEDGAQTLTGFRGGTIDRKGDGWPQDKSLCLIPSLFAASLAYGRNMLRPERTTPRWRIRNLVVWARPNPPVGALGDKFRPATSYLTVATKARDRYFDLDAVRQPASENTHARLAKGVTSRPNVGKSADRDGNFDTLDIIETVDAPPLDYWVIPTAPYKGSHYATFPPDLVVKPVKAMCPLKVCRVCGEPSRPILEDNPDAYTGRHEWGGAERGKNLKGTGHPMMMPPKMRASGAWTECACLPSESRSPSPSVGTGFSPGSAPPVGTTESKWRHGCVLDPFAGSGTTLAVATGHGRDAIGIDLDPRNAELALERVGPLLMTVEYLTSEGAA